MPRTKASSRTKNAPVANKRTRNIIAEEALTTAIRDLDSTVEMYMFNLSVDYEQRSDHVANMFKDIRKQFGPHMLQMTLEQMAQTISMADASTISGNSTAYGHGLSRMARSDEGYLTEESATHSSTISSSSQRARGRPLGPLASAKAKSRRSRSAAATPGDHSSTLTAQRTHNASTLQRSNSQQHQSRNKFRTPAVSRLQTMSAERQMAPVTPKMQLDRPLAMLRYQKIGETVISLSGSPVIAQGVTREGANINIPVANGVLSVMPSHMTSVEPHFMSQLDSTTLQQLRMLQTNLNLMMSQVKD